MPWEQPPPAAPSQVAEQPPPPVERGGTQEIAIVAARNSAGEIIDATTAARTATLEAQQAQLDAQAQLEARIEQIAAATSATRHDAVITGVKWGVGGFFAAMTVKWLATPIRTESRAPRPQPRTKAPAKGKRSR